MPRFEPKFRPLRIIWPVIFMLVIVSVSSIPGNREADDSLFDLGWIPSLTQNLLHIPVYGILTGLWVWALGALNSELPGGLWRAALICSAFSVFDECYQSTIPGRTSSITDVLLNICGIAIALIAFNIRNKRL